MAEISNGKKSVKITPKIQQQAVEWARGSIQTAELGRMWGFDRHHVTQIIYRAGAALREAVKAGLLK